MVEFILVADYALKIKVLGSGCIACERTALNVHSALAELNLRADVEEVREPKRIFTHFVNSTPAVLIDEIVACEGRVPTVDEMKDWIKQTETWHPTSTTSSSSSGNGGVRRSLRVR